MKIERGIPIPKRSYRGRWNLVVCRMELGESILVANHHERQAVMRSARDNGRKLTSRLVNNGIRIWRVRKKKGTK